LLNFGSDPGHILDIVDIVSLPVGRKCRHPLGIPNEAAGFAFVL